MKSREEIMNILEAFDLTGDAGELAGCSHHTVARYVALRGAGGLPDEGPERRERLTDPFLGGLEQLGVTAVAIVPGPMRFPVGIEQPFTSPDDYAGAVFHTFAARINAATASALNSTHVYMWGEERNEAIDAGTIAVTENSLDWVRNNGRGAFVTLDPLWPATGVFVVNPQILTTSTSSIEAMAATIGGVSASPEDSAGPTRRRSRRCARWASNSCISPPKTGRRCSTRSAPCTTHSPPTPAPGPCSTRSNG